MAALKPFPCPFCGKEVKLIYKHPQAIIVCPECKCYMARVDQEEEADGRRRLVDAWNRRTEPKKGQWIFNGHGWLEDYLKCSECGSVELFNSDFCPNCGADMKETEEE